MSYSPRPNASGDTLVDSRDPIRTNFTVLQDRFDENHVGLDGGAGGGKHNFLQMPEQASAPATAANEAGFYAAVNDSKAALFFESESSGEAYQLTTAVDAQIASFGANSAYTIVNNYTGGWTFLPGGLVMMYGETSATSADPIVINFPFTFPNNIFQATYSLDRSSGTVSQTDSNIVAGSLDTTGFDVQNPRGHTWIIRFMAIGN